MYLSIPEEKKELLREKKANYSTGKNDRTDISKAETTKWSISTGKGIQSHAQLCKTKIKK